MHSPADPATARFRILSVDGGGIRGLISVMVLEEIEKRLGERVDGEVRIADYFHLFAGTSTGGLIALALTAPKRVSAGELAAFYVEDGPKIFRPGLGHQIGSLWGLSGPKYSLDPLRESVERRLGHSTISEATRDLLVTSYDMTRSEPYFFKRWRALETPERNFPIAEAALATSAAPTYFPSHGLQNRALVDGGVFAANPSVAAIAEALGRQSDEPSKLSPDELFLVSIGTGEFETGYNQRQVSKWGKLGWVTGGEEPPILGAMLGGASDGADYWAHMLLNHHPGEGVPAAADLGHGPRYYRLQVKLAKPLAMDDASRETLSQRLPAAARELIEKRGGEIDAIVDKLIAAGPIP
ncbi:MAG TPA: patatin-like phospholipase family protein [Solirubrobacterales bacterium]|nr:patatin-like phospholipase family protein [Solirubrobacterales bacterium]